MTIEFGEVNRYDQSGQFPAVDLIFTGPKKSLVDRVSGKSLQFTRNTIGTYVDANGIIQTAAAGEPRYTYDPVTGEELGLLVEESRTNVTWPSDFSSNWFFTTVGDGITQTSYGLTPDGTISSFLVQPNSTANRLRNVPGAGIAAGTYTVSFFYKGDKPLAVGGPGANSSTTDISDYGNGWKRTASTLTFTGGGYLDIVVQANTSVELWGIQAELGSFATSYIPTTSSTVSRDPDTVTLTNDNIYNNSQFDIINDPFGMSAGSNTLTLLPSNSENSAIKRATIFSPNITQTKINTFAKKTDEFWKWRVLGSSFGLAIFATDGQVTVDWGDGTIETLTTSDHTFTNGGGYHEIGFRLDSGTYFRPNLIFNPNSNNRSKLISVGPTPESMTIGNYGCFGSCTNLETIDAFLGTDGGDPNGIVNGCTSLKAFPRADFSLATTMGPSLGGGNRGGWKNCSSLESFPAIDFPLIEDLWNGWYGCSAMRNFYATWSDAVTNMQGAFTNCSSLESFPHRPTQNVENFALTWRGCSSLTIFPEIDTSSGTNFNSAWFGCNSLTDFPEINTSNGTNFANTWYNCSSLTTFPELNLSNGESFYASAGGGTGGCWYGCSSLVTFPAITFDSATNLKGAWRNCTSLQNFPANAFDNWTGTPENECFSNTWANCTSLTATSVENILTSISVSPSSGTPPASGTNITIDYDVASGTPDITVPTVDLIAKGWVPTLNGSAKNDAYSSDFATLDLDFATNLSLTDNISGNNLVTFTRNSIGTYVDSNGVIQTATANTPRFDHDPTTGESLGLLIEQSRTNLIIYSENFDTATTSWYNNYAGTGQVPVITPNAAVSPDGTTNATQIDFDVTGGSTGGDISFIAQVYSANATDYTLSAWIKADSNFNIIFESNTGATNIVSVTTEWQRVSYVKLNTSGNRQIRIGLRADRPVPQSATIYIWGAQLEQGSFATSYIPTDGTPGGIIRAADYASITGTNFSSFYNTSESTWYAEGDQTFINSSGNQEGVSSLFVDRYANISTQRWREDSWRGMQGSTSIIPVFATPTTPKGDKAKTVYAIDGTNARMCVEGVLSNSGSLGAYPGVTELRIGESARLLNVDKWKGHIARLTYWPKRLTDTSLQYLTQ